MKILIKDNWPALPLIALIAGLSFGSCNANAQTRAKQDAQGNFVAVHRSDSSQAKPTGKTIVATDGKTYPVYISSHGKLYFNRVSRNGNTYKSYINIQ